MKTLLCPVDFSAASASAARYAAALAKKFNARLILLHVYETPVLYTDPAFLPAPFDSAMLHESAVRKLRNFDQRVFGKTKTVRRELSVLQGLPSSRICELALERKADLIVMGVTGTGAGMRVLVGSNASRVIRNAPCKVMLIPGKARFQKMKKIVFTTDLSADNLAHARQLRPLAKAFNSEIIFLLVDQGGVAYDQQELEKAKARIRKAIGYPRITGFVSTNYSVAKGVDYFIRNKKADCLAIYTRHRSVLQEMFSPSLTRRLSLHTSVPLLVLHEHDLGARQA
jgi:nucleotide-binding universal stress UspA family protein